MFCFCGCRQQEWLINDHWVPIGRARILEIVQTVHADAGCDSQQFGIDDEDIGGAMSLQVTPQLMSGSVIYT